MTLAFVCIVLLGMLALGWSVRPFVSRRDELCAGERRVMRQFVTLLGAPIGVDRERTLCTLETYLRGLPRSARAGFRLGLWLLDQGPRLALTSWRRFSTLDLAAARRAHLHMVEHRVPTFSQLIEAVHLTVFLALGAQPELDRAIDLDRAKLIATKRAAYRGEA